MKKTNYYTRIAILGAIGFLLMMAEFPLLAAAPFLRLNFSDVPAFLGGFSMGPVAGFAVVLLQNALHLFQTNSGGVGELANCIVSGVFVVTAALVYRKYHTRRGALCALLLGSLLMLVAACLSNLFILFPLYGIPADSRLALVKSAVLPFNAIKAVIISTVTMLLYKPLSSLLKPKK